MDLPSLPAPLAGYAADLPPIAALALLLFAAWLAGLLVRAVLSRVVARLAEASPLHWDDAVVRSRALSRLAQVVPALVVLAGIGMIGGLPAWAYILVRNVALAWIAVAIALALGRLVDAMNEVYERHSPHARERPIKGYLQLAKILVWLVALILVVAALINRSPVVLLTGLGAATAVLMLVFKDTLLSLVASVQLASHDMLRVGDWIEMPGQGVDGDVVDISLHTVKVQNWDKAISTIPTHLLISESFRNWRGMTEAGGRRIKRALLVDQGSVRFLDDTRRTTNLGRFRAYVTGYLRAHPGVHQGMTLMVRQLDPTPHGLPLEVYCFSADVDWEAYENLASDIFDHLLAVLPSFGLRIFQQPGGADLQAGLQAALQPQPGA